MDNVPMMDVTGLVALESALDRIHKQGCAAYFTGVQPRLHVLFRRTRLEEKYPHLQIHPNLESAIAAAESFMRIHVDTGKIPVKPSP